MDTLFRKAYCDGAVIGIVIYTGAKAVICSHYLCADMGSSRWDRFALTEYTTHQFSRQYTHNFPHHYTHHFLHYYTLQFPHHYTHNFPHYYTHQYPHQFSHHTTHHFSHLRFTTQVVMCGDFFIRFLMAYDCVHISTTI